MRHQTQVGRFKKYCGLFGLLSILLILAACSSTPATTTEEAIEVEPEALIKLITFSKNANRSNASTLDGSVVSGKIYVNYTRTSGVKNVKFYLDDISLKSADFTDSAAPYDFAGGTTSTAKPLNTGSLSNGIHTITTKTTFNDGSTRVLTATFLVDNASKLRNEPLVTTSANRTNAKPLARQKVSGNVYVFVIPSSNDATRRIEFYLDDKARKKAPYRTEYAAFYDLNKTQSNGNAGVLDTTKLSNGDHILTTVIKLKSGGEKVLNTKFTVNNSSTSTPTPTPAPDPTPAPAPTPDPTPAPVTSGNYGPVQNPSIPSGVVVIKAGSNINSIVQSYPNNTKFLIKKGVYRNQTINAKKGNHFYGEYGAVLNGAKLLTSFKKENGLWYVTGQTQKGATFDKCLADYAGCKYPEQLFINNKLLKQVTSKSQVKADTWYFDYGADRIYIGQDPSGKTVETSVTQRAIVGNSNVVINNLTIEKYSRPSDWKTILVKENMTVENSNISYNSGDAINITNGVTLKGNIVNYNGRTGIVGGSARNALVVNNEVAYNNTHGFDYWWHAGGIKLTETQNITVRNNYVHNNLGMGIWMDSEAEDTLIEDNKVEDNAKFGIMFEVSENVTIRDNISQGNERGILISSSAHAKVYNNIVKDNTDAGILARMDCRSGEKYSLNNLQVYNNTIDQTGSNIKGWTKGKAAGLWVDKNKCSSLNSWYTNKNNKFYNNKYTLRSNADYYWMMSYNDHKEWKAYGQDTSGTFILK